MKLKDLILSKNSDGVIRASTEKPFDSGILTKSTIDGFKQSEISLSTLPDIDIHIDKVSNQTKLTIKLLKKDIVHGLGQQLRGINKRGYVYESFCSDEPYQTPDKYSLYGAHDFFVIIPTSSLLTNYMGIFIDFPSRIRYDIGFTSSDRFEITLDGLEFSIYLFKGSYPHIIQNFRKTIGKSYLPPKWAFGYQQSRWGYINEEDIIKVADGFKTNEIPIDAIYLDIDYMESYKDFTVSSEKFPKLSDLISTLQKQDIELVPIIDAGVKIETGYDVYEEGIKHNHFMLDRHGQPFVGAVWPGLVHFPDFLKPSTRQWFGEKYHRFLKLGINGFWNDMNEPAIFYSKHALDEAINFISAQKGKELDIHSYFQLKDKVTGLQNSIEDYKSIFHMLPCGTLTPHYNLHNLYGYNMSLSAHEGFKSFNPDKRVLIITRASNVASSRITGIWTGDNSSWWEHLRLNLSMMPSLNSVGFLYSGADTGGFGSHVSPDLLVRWLQFSLFTPLLRNHSAMGTRPQEPWRFGDEYRKLLKKLIEFRYRLIPYIYSEFLKARDTYTNLFSPLAMRYGDEHSIRCEDQLLFSEQLMIAPVVEQNQQARYVYLPSPMAMVTFDILSDTLEFSHEILSSGVHYVDYPEEKLLVFLRRNQILPLFEPASSTKKLYLNHATFLCYIEEQATYTLFDDDGETLSSPRRKAVFTIEKVDQSYKISVENGMIELDEMTFYMLEKDGSFTVIEMKHENEKHFV